MKLCSRLLMAFGRNFCENDQFGYLNPIFGKLRVTHDLDWWLVGKPIVTFYSTELFRYLLRFRNYATKCVQFGCFHRGSTHLHSNFTYRQGRPPSTILGIRKPETLGYPLVKTASLCCSLFWHNTEVWRTGGQTDRQTWYAVTYTAPAKL